jgi:hypothetical protein
VRPCGVLLGGSVAGPVQSQDFAMSFFFFLVSLFYLFFLFFFFSECQIDCEWFDFVKKNMGTHCKNGMNHAIPPILSY